MDMDRIKIHMDITDGQKKMTSKDPFCVYARDLKKHHTLDWLIFECSLLNEILRNTAEIRFQLLRRTAQWCRIQIENRAIY